MSNYILRKAPAFLLKTYEMLQKSQYNHVLHWNEQESGFVIIDQDKFTSDVLPIYFKHSNMHSFIRQLNMYGFSKKRSKGENYYFHPHFVKGKPHLISEIQRKVQNKGPKNNRESTISIEARLPEQEPYETLLQMNYLLLMEQAANLQLILNDSAPSSQKEELDRVVKEYISSHSRAMQSAKGDKPTQALQTTQEMLERVHF